MDLKKIVLRGLGWSASVKFLSQLITWSVTIVVIRLLSPKDYGLMALAEYFIGFLMLLSELGLGAALVQKSDLDRSILDQIFGLVILTNCCLFLLTYLGAPFAASFFKEQRLIAIIRFLSLQFLMISLSTMPQSAILRKMDFRNLSIVEFISAITGSTITLVLALKGWGVWALVYGCLTISMVRTIGLNLISPYLYTPRFSFKGLWKMISFGTYVLGDRILWYFYSRADILIIGKLMTRELLGFYSVGMNLASLPMEKSSGIINQVAFPAFSSIQNDTEKSGTHFLKAVRVMSFLVFPLLWGMSSLAPEIFHNLFGKKWKESIVPFQVIAMVIPIRMVSNLIAPTSIGLGHPEIPFYNTILASIVMPLVMFFCARWGILGVSLAWVIFYPLVFLCYLVRFVPVIKIGMSDVLSGMSRPMIGSLIMYGAITTIRILFDTNPAEIKYIVIIILSGFAVFIGMMLIFNRDGCREILRLLGK